MKMCSQALSQAALYIVKELQNELAMYLNVSIND